VGKYTVVLLGALLLVPNVVDAEVCAASKNWGLYNGFASSHIDAPRAWSLEQGSKSVVVAIVDTGIDPDHKDIRPNLWHDPKSKTTYGWDFVSDGPNPEDNHGHGTHIAGIIGAVYNATVGVSGVARKVSIMSVKYYSSDNKGYVNLENAIKAIHYAVEHGAKIINYSGGGPISSEEEYLAIKEAEDKGVLFVAAAGNDRHSLDLIGNNYYPASYKTSNVVSVASMDINGEIVPSSNWGPKSVDVAAPGENIYSTLPGDKYGYMTGTSQATAFVTGVAALLLSRCAGLKPSDARSIIMDSSVKTNSLKKRVASGRLNAFEAIKELDRRKARYPKLCEVQSGG